MVESNSKQLDNIFRALADPTRRAMLRRLATGEQRVSELAEPFDMSLAAASKHIKVLENAGLIQRTVSGRTHVCRLEAAAMREAASWLDYYERFWTKRLDALERLLTESPKKTRRRKRNER